MVRLHAQLMHAYVVARGHRPHAIKDALRPCLARHGVNHHVRFGQRTVRRFSGLPHQLPSVFKRKASRQRQGEIGKVAGARAPHPSLFHRQHAAHALHLVHQPLTRLCGHLVHQHGHSFAAKVQCHAQDHQRNHHGRKRVSIAQPADAQPDAHPTGAQPAQHGQRRPDVGCKMERIRGQRRRSGLLSHCPQPPRPPVVHGDRNQQHQHRPHRVAQLHQVAENARHGFPDNPRAGKGHEPCLGKCGQVFEFAVAVGVVFVRRLVADSHGKKRQRHTHQVQC